MLVAACTSLFASMVLLKWSSPHFACDVAQAFGKLQACLVNNLDEAFSDSALATPNRALHADLLKRSTTLNIIYQQAAFELRVGRVSGKVFSPHHLSLSSAWDTSEILETPCWDCRSITNLPLPYSVLIIYHSICEGSCYGDRLFLNRLIRTHLLRPVWWTLSGVPPKN